MTAAGDVSVVVVSDYAGEEKDWEDERAILTAFARQDFGEAFETILVENEQAGERIPEDLIDLIPGMKVIFSPSTRSSEMKDQGTAEAKGSLIAVLEADCVPNREWLRVLVEALREHPDFSTASGRTGYPDPSSLHRVLSVLDRGYMDRGDRSETPDVPNNGAVYRREVLEKFPYPDHDNPFVSSTRRVHAMRAAGHRHLFEPGAVLAHALPGWGFVRDLRRNKGYELMLQESPPRYRSIPGVVFLRMRAGLHHCRRLGRRYFKWRDWPLAAVLALALPLWEIPGMLDAIRGAKTARGTRYR